MEARFHSVDNEKQYWQNPSKGKKSWIATNELEVRSLAGELVVTARARENLGSGSRGGIPKSMGRELTIWLTAQDLRTIVNAAFSAGLIQGRARIPRRTQSK